ncbi:MAG: winged helix-turn-helix transcriptional regulator, partial [Candidatus Bathycorpusculaceae bacterium]
KQKILVTLLEKGPLQNSEIAKRVGITEQWCSETINALHAEGLIESQFITPRRINKLTDRGMEVAKRLKEIGENIISESVKHP